MLNCMAVGVDFGFDGGIAAIHEDQIVFAEKVPTVVHPYTAAESDAQFKKWAHSNAKAAKPDKRYKSTRELKPMGLRVYDTESMERQLLEIDQLSFALGYPAVTVAIEEPQIFTGKSSPKTYFASGRGQNAWMTATAKLGIRPIIVSPKHWKSVLGLSDDKNDSLKMADELFELPDRMKEDHDLCEAALLAEYLRTYATRYLRFL